MKRKCDGCGKMDNEQWMYEINYGRSKAWLCHECYKQAQAEVIASEVRSQRRYRKTVEK